jgi:aspartokinase-like uncharacterized kinase
VTVSVVKVGGSLAINPQKLKQLCSKLGQLSEKHELVVVPGGGEFADTVRVVDKRFVLSAAVSHRMAILGMDQYGFLLSDLITNGVTVHTMEKTRIALKAGQLPIFLPSQIMFTEDPLENSWDVTSDSIAACVAHRLQADNLLLVTDIDGVYEADPKKHPEAKLLSKIAVRELLEQPTRTSVDKYLPKLLANSKVECYVVNGLFPSRIDAILCGQETICTQITIGYP